MRKVLQISPSLLDSLAYARSTDEERQDQAFARLDASIRREPFEPTPEMLVGSAWHKALELPPVTSTFMPVDGVLFLTDDVDRVQRETAGCIRETRTTVTVGDALLLCILDGLVGRVVHEVKTSARPLDTERLTNSAQWRLYLLATEGQQATYHLCQLKLDKKSGVHVLSDYSQMTQYAYPGMRAHLEGNVAELSDYIRMRGLESYRVVEMADTPCSACGSPMLKRKGKRGAFLGCAIYPECRQTARI